MTPYQYQSQLIDHMKATTYSPYAEPKPQDMPGWAFALVLFVCTLACVVLVPMMLNGGR